jgi:hypothetical protein
MKNALIVCCAGSQKGWLTKVASRSHPEKRATPSYTMFLVSHQLTPRISPPLLNPVIYSWIKYHHYRLGKANVILVNTLYEL